MRTSDRPDPPVSLWLGGLGLTSLGIQPQILDATMASGLGAGVAGMLSMLEIAAMALASILLFGGRLGAVRRCTLLCGAGLMGTGNLLGALGAGIASAAIGRTVAGLGEGLLAAVGVAAIIASASPVRASARLIACSAAPQLACGMLLSLSADRSVALNVPLLLLAATSVVAIWPILMTRRAPPIAVARHHLPGPPVLAALALCFLLNAIGSAAWTYLGEIGRALDLGARQIDRCLVVSLCAQVAAALLLAWRGPEHRLSRALLAALCSEACAMVVLSRTGGTAYMIAAAAFGFAWQAALPLATGLFRRADTGGGASFLALPVTLLGIAAGPGIAAPLAGTDAAAVFLVGGLLLTAAAAGLALPALVGQARRTRRYS